MRHAYLDVNREDVYFTVDKGARTTTSELAFRKEMPSCGT
jgi:hypothetical protein